MSEYIMNQESLKRHCEAMCYRFKGNPTSGAYGEHTESIGLYLNYLSRLHGFRVVRGCPKRMTYTLCGLPKVLVTIYPQVIIILRMDGLLKCVLGKRMENHTGQKLITLQIKSMERRKVSKWIRLLK